MPIAAAPLPYSLDVARRQTDNGVMHIYIVDANGRKIAAIWGKEGEKEATANLILNAVNR